MAVLYVYAVTRVGAMPECEGIDGSRAFGAVSSGNVAAVFTPVKREEFSQEIIDARAKDLEWLGAIGYRHQQVITDLMNVGPVVPLRAFTLFSGLDVLRSYLAESEEMLDAALDRLDGKREWTLQIEFDAERWNRALVGRVESLAALQREMDDAQPGKAFLLRKKLDDEKKKVSREAEEAVVNEIEQKIIQRLACDTIAETREARDGAFPQINVLLPRDEDVRLEDLRGELAPQYEPDGITLAITGPWPPYTFATMTSRRDAEF